MLRGHVKGFRWTTPAERFWKHVRITEGCWEWTAFCLKVPGHPEQRGHGQIRIDGRCTLAHRFSWELHHGPIDPFTLEVCHRCDNPPCVRPDHLFLGSHTDNMQDAARKGRMVHGEALHNAKLTAEVVRAIRALCVRRTLSYPAIARMYGVTEATVRAAVHGETWRHLLDSETA